jgi:NAD(P)-dependent dehydrogenase (short-subunit alcohol dehydrogenase family)
MTTKQASIQSGFGAQTTAREAIGDRRLEGKVAIVTGGYAGLGLETTRVLAAAGATVIVPARSEEKARAALRGDERIERVEIETLELSDPKSIDAFAERFVKSGRPLHLLVNNAGVMAMPLTRDARGFEMQLATNHIGHFQLTARLWPALVAAKGARVISLSSRGHWRGKVDFDDPHFERRAYDKWIAYGQSKTANILFAVGLDKRGEPHAVRAFSLHPGAIVTELGRHMNEAETRMMVAAASKVPGGFKTVEQGAATTVWCATNEKLEGKGGVYCEDCEIAEVVPAEQKLPIGVRAWAVDPESAERLWTMTETWTGVGLRT